MIDNRIIEQILDRADIVDVVSRFVNLKRKGSNYSCCCPFHNEKTPSFIVSPSRNSWHCFGSCQEGGNAIGFVMKYNNMSFPEAVKELGNIYNIEVEDSKDSSQQEHEMAIKREAMLNAYEAIQHFYIANINANNAEARNALTYASNRWNLEFIKVSGIGYAYSNWDSLVNFATQNCISLNLLEELGLIRKSEKSGKYYDFFRNRLMIPIRSRSNRIIGYTARYIGNDSPDIPKYINSTCSILYSKESTIFGIDTATRAAIKEDKFYLVEGAPDVLRLQSIGANNAVASLGGFWSENQLRQLKQKTQNICFIPDSDPIKLGEEFGAGVNFVIKNGLLAHSLGFNVSVKEIPLTASETKQDPDSYCKSLKHLKDLEEEDFILWYAKKLFSGKSSPEEKRTAVQTIAKLIACIDDSVKVAVFVASLAKFQPTRMLWQQAINVARKEIKESEIQESGKLVNLDLLKKYGFQEQNNCYISINKDGDEYRWSNFIMQPLFHIKDAVTPLRLYKLTNINKQEELIELKQEDLVSLSKFKQRVEGLGNFIWLAKEEHLTKLKMFLYETTETANKIIQLGWQRQGFYAFGNGVFTTEWHAVDDLGIVRLGNLGNYYLPAYSKVYANDTQFFQFERNFVHLDYGAVSLSDYCTQLIDVFGNNAKVGIAFLLATLFRDIVVCYTKSFPILNLFGPKGSGKSELGHSLMSFFIIDNTPPNIQNSTLPALADTVAQCANALVHLDEFKNNIDIDKREFLKGLWDGTGRNRMNMDRDKKREVTKVACGVIVSGQEMATADIALFSRFIFLSYSKCEFTQEARDKFQNLINLRKKGCSHLTLQILKYRAKFEAEFKSNYDSAFSDLMEHLSSNGIEDRILRNWVIPLAAVRTLSGVLSLPFGYNDLLRISVDGIRRQNEENKQNNELSSFWSIVSFLHQDGKIWNEGDYRIEFVSKLKCNNLKYEIEYSTPKQVLYFRFNRIFQLYKMHGRQVNETLLPVGSLTYYLENSPAYIGKKQSVRFKSIQNGYEITKEVKGSNGMKQYKKVSSVDQAMVFDYDLLCETYGISLMSSTIESD